MLEVMPETVPDAIPIVMLEVRGVLFQPCSKPDTTS